jgi:hypothetical protein
LLNNINYKVGVIIIKIRLLVNFLTIIGAAQSLITDQKVSSEVMRFNMYINLKISFDKSFNQKDILR